MTFSLSKLCFKFQTPAYAYQIRHSSTSRVLDNSLFYVWKYILDTKSFLLIILQHHRSSLTNLMCCNTPWK